MKFKLLSFAVFSAVIVSALAGCAGDISSTTPSDSGTNSEQQSAEHVVNFLLNYTNGGTYTTKNVKDGEAVSKPYPDPTHADQESTFAGWAVDSVGSTMYDFTKPVTADLSLYAKWTSSDAPIEGVEVKNLTINYNGDSGNEWQSRELYIWGGDQDAAVKRFENGGSFGTATFSLANFEGLDPANSSNVTRSFPATNIWIIIRSQGGWSWQTPDIRIIFNDYASSVDADGNLELWLTDAPGKKVDFFTNEKDASGDKIISAEFLSWDEVTVTTSATPTSYSVYEGDTVVAEGVGSSSKFTVALDGDIELNKSYTVKAFFADDPSKEKSRKAGVAKLYDSNKFLTEYTESYDDANKRKLGVTVTDDKLTFRVWSPTSSSVELNVYYTGNANQSTRFAVDGTMTYTTKGIWEITIDREYQVPGGGKYDLVGRYYTYTVDNAAGINEVCDPYAVATGLNGDRGMIVDMDADSIVIGGESLPLTPTGWDSVAYDSIENATDLVVYETHVRNLTDDDTWGGKSENRGKFLGFVEEGTTYTEGSTTVTTGYDHLNELNVNAVQLIPIYDQANDEIKNDYNWGYNPLNYNAPEGAYSSNPNDGSRGVYELREMVKGLSETENNTRLIMDVVYNHTSSANSNFNALVPDYYYRLYDDGGLVNGSYCGNDTYTQRPMFRRFIVESVIHWAEEYNIKGYRFDLMGLIDVDTMKLVGEELYKVDPQIVLYGEPWQGGGSGDYYGDWNSYVSKGYAVSDNVYSQLYAEEGRIGVGAFNDQIREGLRGANTRGGDNETTKNLPGWGFISQGGADIDANTQTKERVEAGMKGANLNKGDNGAQTVNYVSAHDNYTLYDTLNSALADTDQIVNLNTMPNQQMVADASVAANGLVLMSQGIPFINGGEEIMRSKVETMDENGNYVGDPAGMAKMYNQMISHNSYKSSAETNSLDYDRKITFKSQAEDYAELVDLRLNSSLSTFMGVTGGYPNRNEMSFWGDDTGTELGFMVSNNYADQFAVLYTGRDSNKMGIGNNTSVVWSNRNVSVTNHDGWNEFDMPAHTIIILKFS